MTPVVIVFPGSNCDRDVQVALRDAMRRNGVAGEPVMVWHGDSALPKADLIVVPGGFSYGDYLRCGAMAAHSPIMRAVKQEADRGVPVLGICNGFQVLTEAGLLPGALLRNAGLGFVCKPVRLRVDRTDTRFTAGLGSGSVVSFPVAHHDGNYFADDATLDRLEQEGGVAFRYCDADGAIGAAANPNGSARGIAGVYNARGNVLGLMPHPERAADPRTAATGGGIDGMAFFDGLVRAA